MWDCQLADTFKWTMSESNNYVTYKSDLYMHSYIAVEFEKLLSLKEKIPRVTISQTPSYITVEPLNNGHVGAGAFVHYSEVSFLGGFIIIMLIEPLTNSCLK